MHDLLLHIVLEPQILQSGNLSLDRLFSISQTVFILDYFICRKYSKGKGKKGGTSTGSSYATSNKKSASCTGAGASSWKTAANRLGLMEPPKPKRPRF